MYGVLFSLYFSMKISKQSDVINIIIIITHASDSWHTSKWTYYASHYTESVCITAQYAPNEYYYWPCTKTKIAAAINHYVCSYCHVKGVGRLGKVGRWHWFIYSWHFYSCLTRLDAWGAKSVVDLHGVYICFTGSWDRGALMIAPNLKLVNQKENKTSKSIGPPLFLDN